MEDKKYELTEKQYHALYNKAFARLADLSEAAERAMRELEELQLTMEEEGRGGHLAILPRPEAEEQGQE